MGSLDTALTRQALAKGIVERVIDDSPVAIRLFYIGSGTVTSVTITTATDITMVTSDGGTDAYTWASYTTVGALVDAINKDGIFEARVLDALRTDLTDEHFVDGAITVGADEDGEAVWDVKKDTSSDGQTNADCYYTVVLTPDGRNYAKPAAGHRVHLQEIQYYLNPSAAEANAVRVYKRRGTVETQIWGGASVDATLTTITFASGEGKLSGNPDDELIVRVQDATSMTDGAGNFLQVVGIYE